MTIKWEPTKCPSYIPADTPCKIVEMSPLEFLSKVPSPYRTGKTAREDINLSGCWSQNSIKSITTRIQQNLPIHPPILDYRNIFYGFPTHEGRHTAYVANKLGAKKIPVIIIGKEEPL